MKNNVLNTGLLLIITGFLSWGCASSAPAAAPRDNGSAAAAKAAQAAFSELEGGGAPAPQGSSPSGAAPASSGGSAAQGGSTASGGGQPGWVRSPASVYDRATYLSATGQGRDRGAAERDALSKLIAIFGQSIQAELKATSTYSDAVKNGVPASYSQNNEVINAVRTSAEMDSLVGAEIRDAWYDGKAVYYAVAVMDKAKTAEVYTSLINGNIRIINELITLSTENKNSFDGVARYQLAATIADANKVFLNVLSIVGAPPGGIPADLKTGDDYRLEAVNITKAIPVFVNVKNDSSNRVRGAFATIFTQAGFLTGGNNTRYVLDVTVDVSDASQANQTFKYARYVIDANLKDTRSGEVLIPYNITDREGHNNYSEAVNRAYGSAEKKINKEYGNILKEFLSSLSVKK
jgi:hypothetical protein